jgi:hypothetical protein
LEATILLQSYRNGQHVLVDEDYDLDACSKALLTDEKTPFASSPMKRKRLKARVNKRLEALRDR